MPADIASIEGIRKLVEGVEKALEGGEGVDVLFANAGATWGEFFVTSFR